MLCYETNLKLDPTRDNAEFLKKKSGAERLKFLADYFFLSYDEAGYAIRSFDDDAFTILFDIIEKKGDIDALTYMHENDTAIHLSFVSIREMDLARFKRYDARIKELEDKLKIVVDGLVSMTNVTYPLFSRLRMFDSLKEGDANDSA